MGLKRRNPYAHEVASRAAGDVYRAVYNKMDSDGGVQATGAGGHIIQATDLEATVPQPGVFCKPAADDELINARTGAGDVIIAVRVAIPSDVMSRNAHEPCLWDDKGNRIELNGDSGVTLKDKDSNSVELKCAGGIEIKPEQGVAKVRRGTEATKAVGLHQDTVNPAWYMTIWINQVSTALSLTLPSDFGTLAASSTRLESA